MKKHLFTALGVTFHLAAAAFAQTSYTFSFTDTDLTPWPTNWLGTTGNAEYHHAFGWGFDDPSAPSDNFTGGTYGGNQNVAFVGAKYDSAASLDATGDLVYTMGWTPNGGKGFVDDGSVPLTGPANQIFQIGLFNGTPTNSWFGTNLLSASGSDSFYLAGTEISANETTQTGSLNLGYFDENGSQLADFGTLNYNASNNIGGGYIFNFRQDIVYMDPASFAVTLTMDQYLIQYPGGPTMTYIGQTSFGTQTFKHGLEDVSALTPGLGIAVHDASSVSISSANYDGGVSVTLVPEPSAAMLSLIALSVAVARRKRS